MDEDRQVILDSAQSFRLKETENSSRFFHFFLNDFRTWKDTFMILFLLTKSHRNNSLEYRKKISKEVLIDHGHEHK